MKSKGHDKKNKKITSDTYEKKVYTTFEEA